MDDATKPVPVSNQDSTHTGTNPVLSAIRKVRKDKGRAQPPCLYGNCACRCKATLDRLAGQTPHGTNPES